MKNIYIILSSISFVTPGLCGAAFSESPEDKIASDRFKQLSAIVSINSYDNPQTRQRTLAFNKLMDGQDPNIRDYLKIARNAYAPTASAEKKLNAKDFLITAYMYALDSDSAPLEEFVARLVFLSPTPTTLDPDKEARIRVFQIEELFRKNPTELEELFPDEHNRHQQEIIAELSQARRIYARSPHTQSNNYTAAEHIWNAIKIARTDKNDALLDFFAKTIPDLQLKAPEETDRQKALDRFNQLSAILDPTTPEGRILHNLLEDKNAATMPGNLCAARGSLKEARAVYERSDSIETNLRAKNILSDAYMLALDSGNPKLEELLATLVFVNPNSEISNPEAEARVRTEQINQVLKSVQKDQEILNELNRALSLYTEPVTAEKNYNAEKHIWNAIKKARADKNYDFLDLFLAKIPDIRLRAQDLHPPIIDIAAIDEGIENARVILNAAPNENSNFALKLLDNLQKKITQENTTPEALTQALEDITLFFDNFKTIDIPYLDQALEQVTSILVAELEKAPATAHPNALPLAEKPVEIPEPVITVQTVVPIQVPAAIAHQIAMPQAYLNLDDEEAFTATPFRELIDEAAGKGTTKNFVLALSQDATGRWFSYFFNDEEMDRYVGLNPITQAAIAYRIPITIRKVDTRYERVQ